MPRGGPRPGFRKPKGAKSKFHKELARILKDRGELTPLEVLQAVQKDPSVSIETVVRAAAAAAPYVHKRKPQAMEIAGRFEFLSVDERELRRRLLVDELRARTAQRSLIATDQGMQNDS